VSWQTPVHPSDLHILEADSASLQRYLRHGIESVGVVDALGEGVDDCLIGQRVYHRWREGNVAGGLLLRTPGACSRRGGGERIDRGADDYKSADRAVAS